MQTSPLPVPQPSSVDLAANWIGTTRRNGPGVLANSIHYAAHPKRCAIAEEISEEISEMLDPDAELLSDEQHARADRAAELAIQSLAGMAHTNPLPASWPSVAELAALYITEVRANGPDAIAGVAEGFSDEGASYQVMTEISEMWARHGFAPIDWYCDDDRTDRANDACIDAADLAIKTFAAELDAATGHRSEVFDRIAGSPLDALATLVIRK